MPQPLAHAGIASGRVALGHEGHHVLLVGRTGHLQTRADVPGDGAEVLAVLLFSIADRRHALALAVGNLFVQNAGEFVNKVAFLGEFATNRFVRFHPCYTCHNFNHFKILTKEK